MEADERETIARGIASISAADQTEVVIVSQEEALARFAHENIHQHVRGKDVTAHIRTIIGKRSGVVSTNRLDRRSLYTALSHAVEITSLAPESDWCGALPSRARIPPVDGAYASATAAATATDRAAICGAVFDRVERDGAWCAGYVANRVAGITVVNTNGVSASFDQTRASLNVKVSSGSSTGFGECYRTNISDIDGLAVAERATRKALDTASPQTVATGDWTVILESPAFGEILSYFLPHFSAQSFDEGSSFCSKRGLDRQYFADTVYIDDDHANALAPGMPFDFEGQPKMRVPLVEFGVVRNVVTDSHWARKLNRANTGNALQAPNAKGPQAYNVVVGAGEYSTEELIASTKRGLLVSRVWYTRTVDQRKAIVTGMTRDGTHLIEDGKLTGGVRNMRFNQSILEALRACSFSRERTWRIGPWHSMLLPAIKIEKFRFTSATDY